MPCSRVAPLPRGTCTLIEYYACPWVVPALSVRHGLQPSVMPAHVISRALLLPTRHRNVLFWSCVPALVMSLVTTPPLLTRGNRLCEHRVTAPSNTVRRNKLLGCTRRSLQTVHHLRGRQAEEPPPM